MQQNKLVCILMAAVVVAVVLSRCFCMSRFFRVITARLSDNNPILIYLTYLISPTVIRRGRPVNFTVADFFIEVFFCRIHVLTDVAHRICAFVQSK